MKKITYVLSLLLALCMVAHAQLTLTGAGRGAPAGGGGGGCSQATTLNAALDGGQATSDITTLICGLVSDDGNNYARLDTLYVAATNSIGNFEVNWAHPGTFNLTPHSAGSCTFTANSWIAGDGSTCYFDTGYNLSSGGGNYTLNSGTLGVCVLAVGNENAMMGVIANGVFSHVAYFGGNFNWAINQSGNNSSGVETTGSAIDTRTGATTSVLYLNGSSYATSSSSSDNLQNENIFLLAENQGAGSPTNFGTEHVAYFFSGAGLTSTQAADVRARLETYIAARGGSGC